MQEGAWEENNEIFVTVFRRVCEKNRRGLWYRLCRQCRQQTVGSSSRVLPDLGLYGPVYAEIPRHPPMHTSARLISLCDVAMLPHKTMNPSRTHAANLVPTTRVCTGDRSLPLRHRRQFHPRVDRKRLGLSTVSGQSAHSRLSSISSSSRWPWAPDGSGSRGSALTDEGKCWAWHSPRGVYLRTWP